MRQTEDYVGAITAVKQVHLMRRLMAARLENAKSAAKRISTFNGLLNQLEDVGSQIFEVKMTAVFLFMTLLETWEDLGTYLPL